MKKNMIKKALTTKDVALWTEEEFRAMQRSIIDSRQKSIYDRTRFHYTPIPSYQRTHEWNRTLLFPSFEAELKQ